MKLYIVMHNDRHADPEPEVFLDKDYAVDYARRTAQEYCHYPEDYEEHDVLGWLFYAKYSCENDSVWVVEKTLMEKK